MSSSGQAPNVSMDELLASIKSMIEGESAGGVSNGVPEGGNRPGGDPAGASADALDDGIMDLTQVAPAPMQHNQAQMPQGQNDEMNAQPYPAERDGRNEGPISEVPISDGFAQVGDAVQQSGSAREAAAQINDILGGLTGEMAAREAAGVPGDESDPMAAALAGQRADAGARHGAETGGDPLGQGGFEAVAGNEMERAGSLSRGLKPADPMAPFEAQAMAGLEQAVAEEQKRALDAEMAAMNAAKRADAGVSDAGHKEPAGAPQGGLQGPPVDQPLGGVFTPQGPLDGPLDAGAGHDGGFGGQPLQGGPLFQPQGQAHGQPSGYGNGDHAQAGGVHGQAPHNLQPQSSQAQHGAPLGGPEAGLDTEFAMGQALQQADASLGAHSAMHNQLPAASPMGRGLQPQGQPMPQHRSMEHGAGHDLPVPAAGRAMVPAAQPMMMADPTAEQLPVEMRNNLEEIVKQLLKPLLREWLERNLPELLRGAVDETGKIDPNRL